MIGYSQTIWNLSGDPSERIEQLKVQLVRMQEETEDQLLSLSRRVRELESRLSGVE